MATLGTYPRVDEWISVHDYIPGQPIPILVRDPKTKRVVSNELKKWVKPYTLVTEPPEITLAPGEVSLPIPMLIDGPGHFEILEGFFQSQQPEGFTVTLMITGDRPTIMNREIHVATMASGGGVTTQTGVFPTTSSAGRPFKFPESYWMDTTHNRAVMAVFRNLSNVSNKIRFNLHGLRWYYLQAPPRIAARMAEIYREKFRTLPFFYTTEQFIILDPGGTAEFDVRFTDEAWTEVVKLMRVSTGRFNVRIREKDSSKRFMEEPLRDDLVFGNGEFPFLLWESSLFEPDYKLTFEVEDLSGAQNTIWITAATRKILWDEKDDRLMRPGMAGGMP